MRWFVEWITDESIWIASILVGVAVLPIIWRLFSMPQKKMQSVPPGSLGWPILGETFDLIACRKSGGIASFFEIRRKKYGDVFKTQMFRPTVVITGVDAQKLFISPGYKSFDAGNFQTMKELFGASSLFTVTGDRHKRVKKSILGFLHGKSLRDYSVRVEKLTIEALAGWEGKEIIALNELSQLSFNIIVDVLLSMEAGQRTVQMREKLVLYSLGGKKLPIKLPCSSFYRALQARRELVKAVREVVDQRKALSGKMYNDVLQSMLEAEDSVNGLSYDEIVDNIILMIFGGTDTTSTTLTRILQFLAENPEEIILLQDEHERVRRQLQPNQPLTWDAIKSMSYTYQVINEGLRMSRIGDALSRTTVTDLQFRGYRIPKGWSVFLDKAATEFNPQIFDEPLRFKPSRFKSPLPPFTFIPFGGGARACPGMELANIEMAVFLYHFVTKYKWQLKEVAELDFTRIVPQPKNGLPIFVELV